MLDFLNLCCCSRMFRNGGGNHIITRLLCYVKKTPGIPPIYPVWFPNLASQSRRLAVEAPWRSGWRLQRLLLFSLLLPSHCVLLNVLFPDTFYTSAFVSYFFWAIPLSRVTKNTIKLQKCTTYHEHTGYHGFLLPSNTALHAFCIEFQSISSLNSSHSIAAFSLMLGLQEQRFHDMTDEISPCSIMD